jgi:hypothetical protein
MNFVPDDPTLTISGGEQAPPGRHPAVCVDVQLLGHELQRDGNLAEKMLIWFELAGLRQADGMPFFIRRKFSTKLSTHRNGILLPFLNAWRGGPFAPAELQNFRIVSVVGRPCFLTLVKTQPDMAGNTWTNILGIEPNRNLVQPSGLYVRRQPKARQSYSPVQQYGPPAPGYQVPLPSQPHQQNPQPAQQPYLPPASYAPPAAAQPPASYAPPAAAQPPASYAPPAAAQPQPSHPTPSPGPIAPATNQQPTPTPAAQPNSHSAPSPANMQPLSNQYPF